MNEKEEKSGERKWSGKKIRMRERKDEDGKKRMRIERKDEDGEKG